MWAFGSYPHRIESYEGTDFTSIVIMQPLGPKEKHI